MRTQHLTTKHGFYYSEMIAMIYFAILAFSSVLTKKFIMTDWGMLSAASIISPLFYLLGDVIAEVYGFRRAMRIFWSAITIQVFFSAIVVFFITLDSGSAESNAAYFNVLGHLFKLSILHFIIIAFAGRLNTVLITKWKFLMRGRYFWLRSIGASLIGQIVYAILIISIVLHGEVATSHIKEIIIFSCIIKFLIILVFSVPAAILCHFLKKIEGVDIYETASFNPFKKRNVPAG